MSWKDIEFVVLTRRGKEQVVGRQIGAFGVYARMYRDAAADKLRTVARLVHLQTSFDVGAFIRDDLAQRAAGIADAHINSDFEAMPAQGRAAELRAIHDAWKAGGMFPSYLMDEGSPIWCELSDADGKDGLELDLLTIRRGDTWLR